jgi:hypothetical protein
MRVVQAAALTAAALLLTSVASAQGLGDAAAREREKRKADPVKRAKVYTEGDIGRSMPPVSATPELPATAEPSSTGGAAAPGQPATEGEVPADGQPAVEPAEGQPAVEGETPAEGQAPVEGAAPEGAPAAPKAAEGPTKAEEEARAKAEEAWRRRLDQARKEEAVYKDIIGKLQLELNDTSGGLYNPGRASKIAFQDENKQKLAEVQGRIAALEDEGRRNRYR